MKSLILIGFKNCGKSTSARYIAQHSRLRVIDTDILLSESLGHSARSYFIKYGERHWRNHEQRLVMQMPQLVNSVIATGAGIGQNRKLHPFLKNLGTVIYLYSSFNDTKQQILSSQAAYLPESNLGSWFLRYYNTHHHSYLSCADIICSSSDFKKKWRFYAQQ